MQKKKKKNNKLIPELRLALMRAMKEIEELNSKIEDLEVELSEYKETIRMLREGVSGETRTQK